MQDIKPFHRWEDHYLPYQDTKSPFFGKQKLTPKIIYNFVLNPLWEDFGSNTLYLKILYADYDQQFAFIELIGEWNDALYNDIMYLKRNVIEKMIDEGICKFILICENVLNFHGSEEDYYEEWAEECRDAALTEGGWICLINTFDHVAAELEATKLQFSLHYGRYFNGVNWRMRPPQYVFEAISALIYNQIKGINY